MIWKKGIAEICSQGTPKTKGACPRRPHAIPCSMWGPWNFYEGLPYHPAHGGIMTVLHRTLEHPPQPGKHQASWCYNDLENMAEYIADAVMLSHIFQKLQDWLILSPSPAQTAPTRTAWLGHSVWIFYTRYRFQMLHHFQAVQKTLEYSMNLNKENRHKNKTIGMEQILRKQNYNFKLKPPTEWTLHSTIIVINKWNEMGNMMCLLNSYQVNINRINELSSYQASSNRTSINM